MSRMPFPDTDDPGSVRRSTRTIISTFCSCTVRTPLTAAEDNAVVVVTATAAVAAAAAGGVIDIDDSEGVIDIDDSEGFDDDT